MFTIFKEEKVITAGILVFLCLSVLVRLMLAWMYHTMIRETDNMATTGNRLLKQCKVKFANCYQLNGGVSNIPVFVDKFLNRLSFGHLSFDAWYHLSGQGGSERVTASSPRTVRLPVAKHCSKAIPIL